MADLRTSGPSDSRTFGLVGLRTNGPSDYRAVTGFPMWPLKYEPCHAEIKFLVYEYNWANRSLYRRQL